MLGLSSVREQEELRDIVALEGGLTETDLDFENGDGVIASNSST